MRIILKNICVDNQQIRTRKLYVKFKRQLSKPYIFLKAFARGHVITWNA